MWRGKSKITVGINSRKTSPQNQKFFPRTGQIGAHFHAETAALRQARVGDVLEVFRVKEDGSFTMSYPCPHCFAAIKAAGISTLRYTDWNGNWQTVNMDKVTNEDVDWYFSQNCQTKGVPLVPGTTIPRRFR